MITTTKSAPASQAASKPATSNQPLESSRSTTKVAAKTSALRFRVQPFNLALHEKSFSNFFSVQSLCSLCLCGCFFEQFLTTETQRTQRLHREELGDRPFVQGWGSTFRLFVIAKAAS